MYRTASAPAHMTKSSPNDKRVRLKSAAMEEVKAQNELRERKAEEQDPTCSREAYVGSYFR